MIFVIKTFIIIFKILIILLQLILIQKKTHPNKVKNAQETHDIVESPKRVLSLQTSTMSRSLIIATRKDLWKYDIKLPDFKAQCVLQK